MQQAEHALTSDDDGADGRALQFRGLEDEYLRAEVEEREEVGKKREVVDTARKKGALGLVRQKTQPALTACCECCTQHRSALRLM